MLMSNLIKVMLGLYVVLFFMALISLTGCNPYRSKAKVKETSIKMEGEEFKIVDDDVYPEIDRDYRDQNVYHIKVVHITI